VLPEGPEDISPASYVRKIVTEILFGEFMKKSKIFERAISFAFYPH
jgi:hypothetical protein